MPPPKLRKASLFAGADEPCFFLQERMLASWEPGKGSQRYQILTVVRGEELVDIYEDMGDLEGPQFQIPGGRVHPNGKIECWENVLRMRDAADQVRNKKRDPIAELKDLHEAYEMKKVGRKSWLMSKH